MIAMDGADCTFLAMILPGEETEEEAVAETIRPATTTGRLIYQDFIDATEDETGALTKIAFKNEETFNFAFDIVDRLGREKPD